MALNVAARDTDRGRLLELAHGFRHEHPAARVIVRFMSIAGQERFVIGYIPTDGGPLPSGRSGLRPRELDFAQPYTARYGRRAIAAGSIERTTSSTPPTSKPAASNSRRAIDARTSRGSGSTGLARQGHGPYEPDVAPGRGEGPSRCPDGETPERRQDQRSA